MSKLEAVKGIQARLNLKDEFSYLDITSENLSILDQLGLIEPFYDDCQNNSPSVKEFIEFTKGKSGYVFECYVVPTNREDTRLSIEAIKGEGLCSRALEQVTKEFHHADEFEIKISKKSFRAWWD